MTLGNAAAAGAIRFRVRCKDCHREIEIDPAEMAERYGAEMSVPEWGKRLVCQCGSRNVDMGRDRPSHTRSRLGPGKVTAQRARGGPLGFGNDE
jgi:hypothetical protein